MEAWGRYLVIVMAVIGLAIASLVLLAVGIGFLLFGSDRAVAWTLIGIGVFLASPLLGVLMLGSVRRVAKWCGRIPRPRRTARSVSSWCHKAITPPEPIPALVG